MTTMYTASDIEVLEGLEPVRKRPAMYIGGTDVRGFHHLLWEIVDNAVDEAINGYADRIEVRIDADRQGVRVSDNGRGIPVDRHPKHKRSALELILTTLHAGGKFAGQNYKVSGGLHGVGASVVNALSIELGVEVWRDGKRYSQRYERGVPQGPVRNHGAARGRGTSVHFRPDPEIFGAKARFDPERVRERLEVTSYLHKGLKIILRDEAQGQRHELLHPRGIQDYLEKIVARRGRGVVHAEAFAAERAQGPRYELALQWTESPEEWIRSYANGIPTVAGGTHESALRQALAKALRAYMGLHKLLPKGLSIAAEDVREGLVALLSVYVSEPQFQGQTKDKLNNPEVTAPLEGAIRGALEQWLNDNPSSAEAIVARV
ncbi:MAG: ATP-binding protein, partial [Polyangiales bacterium]